MGKIRLTRKIQLTLLGDVDERKSNYSKLFHWNDLAFRAANQVLSHLYFQSKQAEFSYLSQAARFLLIDENISHENIRDERVRSAIDMGAVALLNTSQQNSTYRILSEKYKGKLPSDIFNNINSIVSRNFNSERELYYAGERSLRSYKKGLPIPFSERSIKDLALNDAGTEYVFTLFGIRFQTYFGKDASQNKTKFDLSENGGIKLCNSSIQLVGKKIFLLAVFEEQSEMVAGKNEMHAELGIHCAILATFANRTFAVGEKEELLHEQKAINLSLTRAKESVKYKRGGRGQRHKAKDVQQIKERLHNYWRTKMHVYSKRLIDLCVANGCSKLTLVSLNTTGPSGKLVEHSKDGNKTLLPNWTYHGLSEKLIYKCNKVGIEVVFE